MIFYSPIESVYYLLPVIGFVVGFFGTLLGGGGGFVFLPILVLFYNTPTHTAVITSLVATLPIGLLGAVRSEEHTSELQSRGHLVRRLLHATKKIEYTY